MRLQRLTTSVLFLGIIALASCELQTCDPQEIARPKSSETRTVSDLIPVQSQALVEVARLDGFLQILAALAPQLPAQAGLRRFRDHCLEALGFDPFEARSWAAWGLDTAGDARLFNVDKRWYAHVRLSDPETLERWLTVRQGSKFQSSTTTSGEFEITELREKDANHPFVLIAANQEFAFVLFQGDLHPQWSEGQPPSPLTRKQFEEEVRAWTRLDKKSRFIQQRWVKDYSKQLAEETVRVFVKPAEWFSDAKGAGQAATIHARMLAQMGPLAFSLKFDVMKREIMIRALSKSDPGEPAFVQSLGVARGKLPVIGGLADPGVIGIVRLSVDPMKLFALVRSLLEPTVRTELDAKLNALRENLKIDVVQDVLGNVPGNAVMVIYGVDSTKLSPSNPQIAADIFGLRTTREAILIPVDDAEQIGGVLDALTTLSEGKLNRQKTPNSVQYAWIEDEALEWAVILTSSYVVLVDSTAAFNHAITYNRAARPLAESLIDRGVGRLVEGQRSGFYVDTQALSNIVSETGSKEISAWMSPFKSLVLTTEDRKADSETIITLGFADL